MRVYRVNNWFVHNAGADMCEDCNPGYAAPQNRSTTCIVCNNGSFSNTTGAISCSDCAPGSFTDDIGPKEECTKCSTGENLGDAALYFLVILYYCLRSHGLYCYVWVAPFRHGRPRPAATNPTLINLRKDRFNKVSTRSCQF